MTTRHLKTLYNFVCDVINICTSRKTIRKPRVTKNKPNKPVTLDKVQYLKISNELNIKSIDPVKIIKAKQLWVYDTVKRKLIIFKGESLDITGTTIKNIDESLVKTIRKPEEFFSKLSYGKRALETAWKSIRGKTGVTSGRLNENMVLLTVF